MGFIFFIFYGFSFNYHVSQPLAESSAQSNSSKSGKEVYDCLGVVVVVVLKENFLERVGDLGFVGGGFAAILAQVVLLCVLVLVGGVGVGVCVGVCVGAVARAENALRSRAFLVERGRDWVIVGKGLVVSLEVSLRSLRRFWRSLKASNSSRH